MNIYSAKMRVNPVSFTPELYFEGGLQMEIVRTPADPNEAKMYEEKLGRDFVSKVIEAQRKNAVGLNEIEQNRIDLEEYRRDNERLKEALKKISAAYIPGVIGDGYTQVEWVTMHYGMFREIAKIALEDVA